MRTLALALLVTSLLPAATLERALELARAHRYREASREIAGAPVPSEPAQLLAYHRLKAAIASGLNDAVGAAAEMQAALQLAPDNLDLQVAAGIAALQAAKGDWTPAVARLDAIPLAPPAELAMRLQAAQILVGVHAYADAAHVLERAAALAPERPDIAFNTALAQFNAGFIEPAAASAKRAEALGNSAALQLLRGDIEERRGDALAAVHAYQSAVELAPREERYRVALALELLRHQTFPAALAVLEQAAQLFPASARVRVLLGLNYYLVDRSHDAIQALLQAVALAPSEDLPMHYLAELTWLDTATPEPRAVDVICRATREKTVCAAILLRLADENGDASGRSAIIAKLEAAARSTPKDALARCQLGKAYEWANRLAQARVEMEACVALQPDATEGHYRLARIYRQLGLKDLAAEQNRLQQEASRRESDLSARRAETVEKFLFDLRR
ncbi:MAG TPA: hypothetical protein DEQ47_03050 [Solibacterales bacterium]|nr:hypothetical protein [Bryobacterales bacterium]